MSRLVCELKYLSRVYRPALYIVEIEELGNVQDSTSDFDSLRASNELK